MNQNLYETLQNAKQDLQTVPKNLISGTVETKRFNGLVEAFETTAQKLSTAMSTSTNQLDRANLSKLYEGIRAGQRILEKLYEQGLRHAR